MGAIKILAKVLVIIVAVVLLLAILVVGGLNIAKFPMYSEYYSRSAAVCDNPGLGDGFVCQGLCYDDESGKFIVSGYMADKSASRLYVTDKDSNSYYVSLNADGKKFTGHVGGVATAGDTVYIASGGALHLISRDTLLSAKSGDTLEIEEKIEVNNEASFAYAEGDYIYVGEFHDGGAYVTEHPYETADGTYYAIVSRYSVNDLTAPDRVYSIRDKVQGIAFTEGKVIMSTSYGLTDSVYYIYDESAAVSLNTTLDGAPIYALTELEHSFKGPAMSEGIDVYDGKIITMTECASNKYIFGKLFFANKIDALDIL